MFGSEYDIIGMYLKRGGVCLCLGCYMFSFCCWCCVL